MRHVRRGKPFLENTLIHHHNPLLEHIFLETEPNLQKSARHFFGRLANVWRLLRQQTMTHNTATSSCIPARQSRKSPLSPTRQIAPLYPPHFCQLGGTLQANRRTPRHKFANPAHTSLTPASHVGGNFLNPANRNNRSEIAFDFAFNL
jgi:hypothetical protein